MGAMRQVGINGLPKVGDTGLLTSIEMKLLDWIAANAVVPVMARSTPNEPPGKRV